MKGNLRLLIVFMTLFTTPLLADNYPISGVIMGEGEPLIGATVSVKGTSTGTIWLSKRPSSTARWARLWLSTANMKSYCPITC